MLRQLRLRRCPRCNWASFNYAELIVCEGECCRGDYEEFGTGDEFLNFIEGCFEQVNGRSRLTLLEDG